MTYIVKVKWLSTTIEERAWDISASSHNIMNDATRRDGGEGQDHRRRAPDICNQEDGSAFVLS